MFFRATFFFSSFFTIMEHVIVWMHLGLPTHPMIGMWFISKLVFVGRALFVFLIYLSEIYFQKDL